MFKLEPNPKFWASVSVHVPGQGVGTFDVEFKHLKHVDRKSYVESLSDKTNIDALMEVISDWRGVDSDFSRANLEALLNEYPTATDALYGAYWKELTGAAEKN